MNKRRAYIGGGLLFISLLIFGTVLIKTVKVIPLTGQINPRAYGLGCDKIIDECNGLVAVDCNAEGDGPLYYVNSRTGAVVARCGGFCERVPGCPPGTCPPPEWMCGVE